MNEITHLILDMDGVLWRSTEPMPGLTNFFDTLHQLSIPFIMATNNASNTPAMYVDKLAKFGANVTADQILTSAVATGLHLQQQYPQGGRVVIVGDVGLHQALTQAGFDVINPPGSKISHEQLFSQLPVDLVVVGFTLNLDYLSLAVATAAINQGAAFYGANPDLTYPSPWGPLPGAGSIQALLTAATDVEPITIGKPAPLMFEVALRRLGSPPATTAMVGDRLNTDIAGGTAAGLKTILTLSGITQPSDLDDSPIQPDYVVTDITDLATKLKQRL
ncbi:MAG TPA: HAD-IIA family hydrolase [Anaerolineae bacterium]|nr:HAD-IIA family hydrolase [Anaerolineae bacterium]